MMREAFLGKIIDLILSAGIFTLNNIKILCWKKAGTKCARS